MAKKKRIKLGNVVKSKDATKPNYLQVQQDITLKKGQYINFESKKYQIESLNAAIAAGRLSEEIGTKMLANIEKQPEWVLVEAVTLVDEA